VKIAALADLHGHFPDVPDCDVVVIAGDIVLFDPGMDGLAQAHDLRDQLKRFRTWLNALNMRGIIAVGVAGNHDFPFQEVPDLPGKFNWHYLYDSHTQIDDVIFFGSPWQPWMGGWAFNAPEDELDDPNEPFLDHQFGKMLGAADVIVTHSPPAGFHDTVAGAHRGSIALNKHIERVEPRLAIYGHIHQPGVETVGRTTLCNAAYVGFNRRPNGHPIQVFEL